MKELFGKHLASQLEALYKIMEQGEVEELVIHAGFLNYYYRDDQPVPFRSNPYFSYLCPAEGESHFLHLKSNQKPKLYYYSPDDFWHESSELKGFFWQDFFEIEVCKEIDESIELEIANRRNTLAISPDPEFYTIFDLKSAPEPLISQLNWLRTQKTPYEIECHDKASALGAKAHLAAKNAFFAGKSEYGILIDYLSACEQRESQLPYNSIIALDSHSAILHYQITRFNPNGKTLLIDAGAKYNGYCSDITRCYFQTSIESAFQEIHAQLNESQQKLCTMVKPGQDYKDIQTTAREMITEILCDVKVFHCSKEQAMELGLSKAFFPHGVGHALGLQVHDVAGKQKDANGTPCTPIDGDPYLRLLRPIRENDVLTIEPGIYFIPMLLNKLKTDGKTKAALNWNLIEKLIPLGGIRIEDNIVATPQGPNNLTRKYLSQ